MEELTFDKFKDLARNSELSSTEQIGFTCEVRTGFEPIILADLCSKIPSLTQQDTRVLDIGCGCGELTNFIIQNSIEQQHDLFLLDSAEMLANVDSIESTHKLPGKFPQDFAEFITENKGSFDIVIAYSVAQYVNAEACLHTFVRAAFSLLKPGGHFLLGDVPIKEKRDEYFKSPEGIKQHQEYIKKNNLPPETPVGPGHLNIEQKSIYGIMYELMKLGDKAQILPQDSRLPMSKRRADILFTKKIV